MYSDKYNTFYGVTYVPTVGTGFIPVLTPQMKTKAIDVQKSNE